MSGMEGVREGCPYLLDYFVVAIGTTTGVVGMVVRRSAARVWSLSGIE